MVMAWCGLTAFTRQTTKLNISLSNTFSTFNPFGCCCSCYENEHVWNLQKVPLGFFFQKICLFQKGNTLLQSLWEMRGRWVSQLVGPEWVTGQWKEVTAGPTTKREKTSLPLLAKNNMDWACAPTFISFLSNIFAPVPIPCHMFVS